MCTVVPAAVLLAIIDSQDSIPFMAVTMLLLSIRLVSFLRAYRSYGHLVQMIHATAGAMTPFLSIMLIILVGLAFGWAVLATAHPDGHFLQEEDSIHCNEPPDNETSLVCGSVSQPFRHFRWRLFASFNLMYRLTVLGDFPGDAFALADFSGNDLDRWGEPESPRLETAVVAWAFFGLGTLFFLVLLLNLLIAIIGDKYEEIQLKAEIAFRRQRANICLEALDIELFPGPDQERESYLIMAFPKEFELHPEKGGCKFGAGDEWEGRCKRLERLLGQQEQNIRGVLDKHCNTIGALEGWAKRLDGIDKWSDAHSSKLEAVEKSISEVAAQSKAAGESIHGHGEAMRGQHQHFDQRLDRMLEVLMAFAYAHNQCSHNERSHGQHPDAQLSNSESGMHDVRRSHSQRLPQRSSLPPSPFSSSLPIEQPASSPAISNSPEHRLHGRTICRNISDVPHGSHTSLHTHGQHSHGQCSHVQMAFSETGSDASDAHGHPPLPPSPNVLREQHVAPRRRQANDNSSPLRQQSCDASVQPSTSSGSMPHEQHRAHRRRRSQRPIQMRSSADLEQAGR